MVQLGDLIKIEKGKKAPQILERSSKTSRNYLQIDDLRPDAKPKHVEPFECPIATPSDVIIAWDGANAGTVSCNLNGYIGSTLAVLRPKTGSLLAPYLSRFLEGKFEYLQTNATGATIPHLSRDVLEEIKIPLPDLYEQRRIAARLEQADQLRRSRRYALELTDTFLPAAFVKLFGETLTEKQRWPEVELADLLRGNDKVNYGVVQPGFDLQEGIPIIRVADLDDLESNFTNLKLIAAEIDEQHSASRLVGDELLIACVGSIGKIAKAFPKLKGFNIARAVARIPGDWNRIDRNFLAHYLSARRVQNFWLNETRTVAQPTLNILQIEETPVIMPPLSIQQKFTALVLRVESLRAVQRESLRQAEHLFASLLHQTFTEDG